MDLTNIAKVMRGEFGVPPRPQVEEADVVSEETPRSCVLFESIRTAAAERGVADDDTYFRLYIDSKLESLGDSSRVCDYVDRKLAEYGVRDFNADTQPEKGAGEADTKPVAKEIEDALLKSVDKAFADVKQIESALSLTGVESVVDTHVIGKTECVRVKVTDGADKVKTAMESLGFKYKSKYKDCYHFVY